MCRFQIHNWRKLLVWLGAKELKEWFEKGKYVSVRSHGFDSLSERLDNLNRQFFGATHDPVVTGDSHVREDRVRVESFGGLGDSK